MKKLTSIILISIVGTIACYAQKAHDAASVNDIFRVITYRYITLKNEANDTKALQKFYTKVFKAYGYIHGLPGDGYGGPCAIIDGFYKGGHISKKKFNQFVPTRKKAASVLYMSACNDGDDGDYGYLEVTLTVYDKGTAQAVLADIKSSGFTLFEYDNPDEAGDSNLYYNGDKQVRHEYNKHDRSHNFFFSIAQ